MEANNYIAALTGLIHLDSDAVYAYHQAIENIEEDDIRRTLSSFCSDHDRHVTSLSLLMARIDAELPACQRTQKGFISEGMTAVDANVGTRSALMAMLENETLTNARYKRALVAAYPVDVRQVIESNYRDEQRHIAYIKDVLKNRFGLDDVLGDARRSLSASQPTEAHL